MRFVLTGARRPATLLLLLLPPFAAAWDDRQLTAPVVVNGYEIPYPVFAIFVMPDTAISTRRVDGGRLDVRFAGRPVRPGGRLAARARPGFEVLELRNPATGETCRIHVFTLVPASRVNSKGRLNGYRIGRYPDEPLRGLDIYLPPKGFVEVTAENADVPVSPNFTLGEFVAKQEAGFPKYLVLRPALLLKLETILQALNEAGRTVERFVVMSGYRTPFYNAAIGNVPYSRHVWGGAADIYIDDAPRDGEMDDLNADGRIDRADAEWLAAFIDDLSDEGRFGTGIGGIGIYDSNEAHGPFVHVDTRGFRARW
jgi:hypothetical protein